MGLRPRLWKRDEADPLIILGQEKNCIIRFDPSMLLDKDGGKVFINLFIRVHKF